MLALCLAETEATEIYKQSIQHLENYEPIYSYVGKPYRVQSIQEVTFDESSVTMVVPIRGPKGKANLIINGKKGEANE